MVKLSLAQALREFNVCLSDNVCGGGALNPKKSLTTENGGDRDKHVEAIVFKLSDILFLTNALGIHYCSATSIGINPLPS
jgi:hypothetical protein